MNLQPPSISIKTPGDGVLGDPGPKTALGAVMFSTHLYREHEWDDKSAEGGEDPNLTNLEEVWVPDGAGADAEPQNGSAACTKNHNSVDTAVQLVVQKQAEEDDRRRQVLAFVFLVLAVVAFFYLVVNLVVREVLRAALSGASLIVLLVALWHCFRVRRLAENVSQAVLLACSVLSIFQDLLTCGLIDTWVFIPVLLLSLVSSGASTYAVSAVVVLGTLLTFATAIEATMSFGLYSFASCNDIAQDKAADDPYYAWARGMQRLLLMGMVVVVASRANNFLLLRQKEQQKRADLLQAFLTAASNDDLVKIEDILNEAPNHLAGPMRALQDKLKVYQDFLMALSEDPDAGSELGIAGFATPAEQSVSGNPLSLRQSKLPRRSRTTDVEHSQSGVTFTMEDSGLVCLSPTECFREVKSTIMAIEIDIAPGNDRKKGFDACVRFVNNTVHTVRSVNGTVLEVRADAVVSIWHLTARHSHNACRAALRTRAGFESMDSPFRWSGVSLASGVSVLGVLDDRKVATGLPMTQARLLLPLARRLSCKVLVTESVKEAAENSWCFRAVDIIPSDPLSMQASPPTTIYELRQKKLKNDHHYADAFRSLKKGDLQTALQQFVEAKKESPQDLQASRMYNTLSVWKPPEVYTRRYIGWQDFGYLVPGQSGAKSESYMSSECSKSELHDQSEWRSMAGSEKELRNYYEVVEKYDPAGYPPKKFSDRRKNTWLRSSQRIVYGASVWLVLGGGDGTLCAVKAVRVTDERKAKSLMTEVGMLDQLKKHENVIGYISSCIVDSYVMTVMEYAPGGSLADILERFGPLPITVTRRFTRDILKGLVFLHSPEVKIVHNDLKPHNVLLQADGICKLADFGAAARLKYVLLDKKIGTPPYISPEACSGLIERPSDIWSLGIMVCELLTGKHPFSVQAMSTLGSSRDKFLVQLLQYDPQFMPIIPSELDEFAFEFVSACLKKDAHSRPKAEDLLFYSFCM